MTPDNPAAEVPPEVRAQWREWATERPGLWTQAVLNLLDALDAAERERDVARQGLIDLGRSHPFARAEAAEQRLAAVRALADERLAVHGPHVECNNAGCRRRGLSGMHCADPCEEPHEDCADFAAWTKVRAALGDADGGGERG